LLGQFFRGRAVSGSLHTGILHVDSPGEGTGWFDA
jgi:hypothetical protein